MVLPDRSKLVPRRRTYLERQRDQTRAEVERLRQALEQAAERFFQVKRDRCERDKVFATCTTAAAEIERALDETQAQEVNRHDGGSDGA